ncbi:hypothetical protein [Pelomonas sp. KK5]|uniref:hypothetical protein n=1 Tax=Pelomonas sp. KK5 TaxID=1855730 RepID=UPI00097C51F7|nr:hypothetical protein [Pelomonas sp. KK5]
MSLVLAKKLFAALAITAVYTAAQAQEAVVVKDYDVYVDPPTAFAYIKLPGGWKFIGKLDVEQMKRLPPGTLTSLLPPEQAAATRMAMAARPAKTARQ